MLETYHRRVNRHANRRPVNRIYILTDLEVERFQRVTNRAQSLYGAVSHVLPRLVVTQRNRNIDAFQNVLAHGGLVSLWSNHYFPEAHEWAEFLSFCRSHLSQTIGRLEEEKRRGEFALTQDEQLRWRRLIRLLERGRNVVALPFRFALRSKSSLVERFKESLVFQVLTILTAIVSLAAGLLKLAGEI